MFLCQTLMGLGHSQSSSSDHQGYYVFFKRIPPHLHITQLSGYISAETFQRNIHQNQSTWLATPNFGKLVRGHSGPKGHGMRATSSFRLLHLKKQASQNPHYCQENQTKMWFGPWWQLLSQQLSSLPSTGSTPHRWRRGELCPSAL